MFIITKKVKSRQKSYHIRKRKKPKTKRIRKKPTRKEIERYEAQFQPDYYKEKRTIKGKKGFAYYTRVRGHWRTYGNKRKWINTYYRKRY